MNPRLKELLEHFKTRPNECIVKDLQKAFDFMSKHDFSNEDIKQATCRLWDEATYKCRRYRPMGFVAWLYRHHTDHSGCDSLFFYGRTEGLESLINEGKERNEVLFNSR